MEPGGTEERNKETEAIIETQYPHFPDEIIVRILSMLPVKSLLQLKCVSRRWSFLISDPDFKLSVQRQHVILPTRYEPRHSIRMIDDEASVMELHKALVDIKSTSGVRIRGSCNGYLLLNADYESFFRNPMTPCSKKVLSHEQLSNSYGDDTISGLCYDSSTDDYKAVMTFTDLCSMFSNDKIVMAGSFKDKIWTEIRFPYNRQKVVSGPTVNGCLHWLISKNTGKQNKFSRPQLIVCFSPLTNEFTEVPMPQCKRERNEKNLVVFGLNWLVGMSIYQLLDRSSG